MKWYDIKASGDVYLYDEIGGFGIPASQFVQDLNALKGRPLNVFINSPGGDAFAGIAIFNALSRHDAAVNVTVDGIAASIASVIAQAGSKRTMAKSSALMIHDAWGLAVGNADTMAKMQGELDDLSNSIADIYADKAGGTPEDWRDAMRTETWYRAEDAVTAGLADFAISAAPSAYSAKVYNLSNYSNVPEWVNHAEPNTDPPVAPPEPTPSKEDDMDDTAIRQALGLDDDGDIEAAITALQTQVVTLTSTIAAEAPEKGEAAALRAELQESRQSYLALENERNREHLSLREQVASLKAEGMVDKAIAQGRITPANRDIALAVARSGNDFDAFVKTLPSVNFQEVGTAGDDAVELTPAETSIAKAMGNTEEQLRKVKGGV